MPAGDAGAVALVDMRAFIAAQCRERYRAFLVHGPPRSGKSMFARKLAESCNGVYMDVMADVSADAALAQRVDVLDVRWLNRQVLDAARDGCELVVVDELDFLVPVWGGDHAELVELLRKLSVTETQAVVGFILRTAPALEALELRGSAGQRRVLRLDEIQGL